MEENTKKIQKYKKEKKLKEKGKGQTHFISYWQPTKDIIDGYWRERNWS